MRATVITIAQTDLFQIAKISSLAGTGLTMHRSHRTRFPEIMCSDHEHDQHLLSTVVSETVRQKGKSQSKVQSGLCIRAGENSQNQSDNRWNVTLYKCRRLEHILENI